MKLNSKKGISLIVLVITIIVMIILAAAIILSLQSSGIIGRANEAKLSSDMANKRDAANLALAEYDLLVQAGQTKLTASQYVMEKLKSQGIDASNVVVDDNRNIIIGSGASAINAGVKLGEYVNYVPQIATSSKYKTFDSGLWGDSDTYFSTQTGDNAFKWRYMGTDKDGNALLVADTVTTDLLHLSGATGWLQGLDKLNALCKELYSGEKGTARSITVEDVNKLLGATPVAQYIGKNGITDNEENLTIGEIISEKGEAEIPNTTPDKNKNVNSYVVDYYTYNGTEWKANTSAEYKLIFEDATGESISYWLASSCVRGSFAGIPLTAEFSVRSVASGKVEALLVLDCAGECLATSSIRPVVILNSDVEFKSGDNNVWTLE